MTKNELKEIREWVDSDRVELILYGNDGFDSQRKIIGQETKDIFMQYSKSLYQMQYNATP